MKRSNIDAVQEDSRKKRRVDADDDPLDYFGTLPEEILDIVLQNHEPEDDSQWLTVIGTVCNKWHKLSKKYVRRISIKHPSTYILSEVIPALPNVCSMSLKKPVPVDLASLTTMPKLKSLAFKCPRKMTDQLTEEMKHSFELIGQLTQLLELNLYGPVSDENIQHLSSLVNLEFLFLSDDNLTEQSVQVVRHLTALQSIDLPLQWNLGPAFAKLTNLRMLNAASSDNINTLEDLTGLVNLVQVDLGEIPDAHVGHIGVWTNLQTLSMSRVRVHDSIRRWSSLQKLQFLELSYSEITPQLLRTVINCTNLRSIYFEEGDWIDWDFVAEDLLANISRLTNLESFSDIKHHPVFDRPISRLPDSLTQLDIVSDNGLMREEFFANINHLTNLKKLKISYTQGGKQALNSAIIEGLSCLNALKVLEIGNARYNHKIYPIYREKLRKEELTGEAQEQYANLKSSFPNVSFTAFSSLTNLRELKVDLDPFFESQVLALTTLTKLKTVQFGKHFSTKEFCQLLGRPNEDEDEDEYEDDEYEDSSSDSDEFIMEDD